MCYAEIKCVERNAETTRKQRKKQKQQDNGHLETKQKYPCNGQADTRVFFLHYFSMLFILLLIENKH